MAEVGGGGGGGGGAGRSRKLLASYLRPGSPLRWRLEALPTRERNTIPPPPPPSSSQPIRSQPGLLGGGGGAVQGQHF